MKIVFNDHRSTLVKHVVVVDSWLLFKELQSSMMIKRLDRDIISNFKKYRLFQFVKNSLYVVKNCVLDQMKDYRDQGFRSVFKSIQSNLSRITF
jgi:hypothetical protein